MRIADCADKAVRAGNWHSEDDLRRYVYHYRTAMLSFNIGANGEWDGDLETVDYSIGHGSVSDQNGMNVLFARLAMPLYYARDRKGGGARIERLNTPNFKVRNNRAGALRSPDGSYVQVGFSRSRHR